MQAVPAGLSFRLPRCSGIVNSENFNVLVMVNMVSQNAQLMAPWQASLSVLHVVAISSTVFRLSQRYSSQKLWHDDYVALFSVIADCVFFVVLHVWTRSEPNGAGIIFPLLETTITSYWISITCSFLVSWSAKASLALAIARIFPPGRVIRRFAMGMAWSFGILGIVFLLGMSILCGCDTSWHDSPEVQCDLSKTFNAITFCASLISDTLLVVTPLRMLWRMRLPDDQRRLILAGFAASVWTSIAVGVCFVIMFGPDNAGLSRRIIRPLLGHVMASVSLMVCNAMVVFAFVYRLVRKDKDLEHSISEAVSNSNMSPLTTVILSGPGSLDRLSQSSYRRGTSYNGYSFSERTLASSSSSSLFTTSRTVPQISRSA